MCRRFHADRLQQLLAAGLTAWLALASALSDASTNTTTNTSTSTNRAPDAVPASTHWTLLGGRDGRSHDSEAAAIRHICDQLNAQPPRSVNSITRVARCGASVQPTASLRNVRVSYDLLAHDPVLKHDTVTPTSFLLQRKASCSSDAYPHLREDDGQRFHYSCWRCPVAELQDLPPRFLDDHRVHWYRRDACPQQFDARLADNGTPLVITRNRHKRNWPVANRWSAADDATFRLLRDAPYGQLVELQLGSGERLFFVGDEPRTTLTPADRKHGQLSHREGHWWWLNGDGTRYQFGPLQDGFSEVISKQTRDGQRWRYFWRRLGAPTADTLVLADRHRLDAMIDGQQQRYELVYDRRGELASLIMKGAGQETKSIAGRE